MYVDYVLSPVYLVVLLTSCFFGWFLVSYFFACEFTRVYIYNLHFVYSLFCSPAVAVELVCMFLVFVSLSLVLLLLLVLTVVCRLVATQFHFTRFYCFFWYSLFFLCFYLCCVILVLANASYCRAFNCFIREFLLIWCLNIHIAIRNCRSQVWLWRVVLKLWWRFPRILRYWGWETPEFHWLLMSRVFWAIYVPIIKIDLLTICSRVRKIFEILILLWSLNFWSLTKTVMLFHYVFILRFVQRKMIWSLSITLCESSASSTFPLTTSSSWCPTQRLLMSLFIQQYRLILRNIYLSLRM